MTSRALFPLLITALWGLASPLSAQTPRDASDAVPLPVVAAAAVAGSPAVPSAGYDWRGREAEIEAFLRTEPITRFKDIPVGITKPRRAYFAPGGLAGSMAWKPLPEQLLHGKFESYKSEIAAYEISKALGLDMVPPVVERRIKGVKGAGVYWIEGVRPWDPKAPPKVSGPNWSRQTSRMFMFDQLIANIDRNQGNLLYDDEGRVFLIDHSRAFTSKRDLGGLAAPQQYDRALWERMAALTAESLTPVVGDWLTSSQIDALLRRRDAMRRQIDRRLEERGAAGTFLP